MFTDWVSQVTLVYEFSIVAMADYDKLSSLNNTKLFFQFHKSEVQHGAPWAKSRWWPGCVPSWEFWGNLASLGCWQTSVVKSETLLSCWPSAEDHFPASKGCSPSLVYEPLPQSSKPAVVNLVFLIIQFFTPSFSLLWASQKGPLPLRTLVVTLDLPWVIQAPQSHLRVLNLNYTCKVPFAT